MCNNGVEANDLALLLAREYTTNKDLVTFEGSYHGYLSPLLEVSPKLPHMSFMPNNNTGNGNSGSEDPLRDLRMPSVGPSPSTFTDDAIR